MSFLVLHPADASGEALWPAPFCLLFGSPVPPTRAVPRSCPLRCQTWRVPGHHRGLWVLRQQSWAQGLLKAEGCCCPKDFSLHVDEALLLLMQHTVISSRLLGNTVCIHPYGARLCHPYPRVLSPHVQLKQPGRSPSTHCRRDKTRVLGSEGLELVAGSLAVYLLLENSLPWRKMASVWVREWVWLLWGKLEQNTRWKLFALSFQHVLV